MYWDIFPPKGPVICLPSPLFHILCIIYSYFLEYLIKITAHLFSLLFDCIFYQKCCDWEWIHYSSHFFWKLFVAPRIPSSFWSFLVSVIFLLTVSLFSLQSEILHLNRSRKTIAMRRCNSIMPTCSITSFKSYKSLGYKKRYWFYADFKNYKIRN